MIPEAEALLLTTGLLKLPDKTSVRAARAVEKEIVAELKAALKRERPGRLYVLQAPRNYFDRLLKFQPDYAETIEYLGPELGAEYQIAQMQASQLMQDIYPRKTIDTELGPRAVEISEIDINLYTILADTIEDYLRIPRDLAAGVLTSAQVQQYKTVYPDSYKFINQTVTDELIKMGTGDPDLILPLWLEDSIRVLRGKKLGRMVRKEPKAAAEAKPGNFKLDDLIDAAKTPGQ